MLLQKEVTSLHRKIVAEELRCWHVFGLRTSFGERKLSLLTIGG
jgi:hypothetical protein